MGKPGEAAQNHHKENHATQDKKPIGDDFIRRIYTRCIHNGLVSHNNSHANSLEFGDRNAIVAL
jgi:hypothetical protein